ncbi:MAG: phosphatase PAP2 family protein [Ilumatobacteraceae bacterium]
MNRTWAWQALLALVLFVICAVVVRVGISEGSRESAWIPRPFGEWPAEVTHVTNTTDIQFSIFATYATTTPETGAGPSSSFRDMFGRPTVGSVVDTFDSENINGSRYITGILAGWLRPISVYVATPVDDAPNDQFELAIYEDAAGAPGRLLATSDRGTLTADTWNTVPISAELEARTAYWLMYNSNGTNGTVNNPTYTPVVGNPLDHVIRAYKSPDLFRRVELAMSIGGMIPMTIVVAALAIVAGRRRLVGGVALAVGYVLAMLIALVVREAFFEPYGRFPSGHALRIVYVAVWLAFLFPRPAVRIAGVVAVLAMCIGSVYSVGHYSEELLAGALLGWAFARGATAVAAGPTPAPTIPSTRPA